GAAGRKHAGISDLVNGVDAVAAAAFGYEERVIEDGQAGLALMTLIGKGRHPTSILKPNGQRLMAKS
ncbi:MAG TPA: hypothetical protein VGN44_06970, partial [Candidatus Angelobacter sp.]